MLWYKIAEEKTYPVQELMKAFKTRYAKTMLKKYIKELGIPQTGTLTDSQLDYFIDGYM